MKDVEVMKNMKKDKRIQCHFVSNTHWDREWRFSMQRTRHMLVYKMDMLLDIFDKEPRFKSFHLDSQTLPLEDYLEIRPERKKDIEKYVAEGRLLVGPWYCLPDEFSVSGESLIRNLLLGHKIAASFGKVSKTGYSPFSWGQISQMPQIYSGFGIDFMAFYRGINTIVAPQSEVFWEGPDGTKILASRLGCRPRYNVWYVIQRPVYWNEKDVDNRYVQWENGHAPFRMIDKANGGLDAQYAHPRFEYFKENIPESAQNAIEEQDADWSTAHRFWSCGHDSSCPDVREVNMIDDCAEALNDTADVFHSTFADFQKAVCENVSDDLSTVTGEMRHYFTEGSTSVLFAGIISARMDIKQENFRTERDITVYAEPLAAFSAMLGGDYSQAFIDKAYHWLLQNHGHDSIGGCSRDIISDDMVYRYRQSREISNCVTEQSMMEIARSIDLSAYGSDEMAILVYNPLPYARTEVLGCKISIPRKWEAKGFDIVDENGRKVAVQVCNVDENQGVIVQAKNDVANVFCVIDYDVLAEFTDIPSMGYRTFFVKPYDTKKFVQPDSQMSGPQTMENEFISVTVNSNGTLKVHDKLSGKVYDQMGYFRDTSEIGNPWEHISVENEEVYTTLNERAKVAVVLDGKLETTMQITLDWSLPESRTMDDKSRSSHLKPYKIVSKVTLRSGQRWVDVETEVDNCVEDHYLMVSFPTGINTDVIMVQGQFDVVARSVAKPDYSLYQEVPHIEHPMNSFIDLSDGKDGIALLNEGLKAYEVHDGTSNTVSLTLLRCIPLRICVTQEMTDYSKTDKGAQCLGKQTFRYGIMSHPGDWKEGDVWQGSECFNYSLLAAQVGPTVEGNEPLSKSFLELEPDQLNVSAVKRSEDGQGWVVRLFNPYDETVKGRVRLNSGLRCYARQSPIEREKSNFELPKADPGKWSKVEKVTLEEISEEKMAMDSDGWVGFSMPSKKIMTIKWFE